MIEHGLDAGIEARAVEAVGEIVSPEDPQCLLIARLVLLSDGEAEQALDPVADEAEDLLLRAQRQAQVPQREVDGRRDVPLGLDQRAVEIEDEQVDLMHPVEYIKFICHCEAGQASRSNLAVSGQAPQSRINQDEIATLPLVARNDRRDSQ